MSLEIDIKNAIHEICMDKYREKKGPVHAPFKEILKKLESVPQIQIEACLANMVYNGKLWRGRTAQDECYRNVPKN